MDTGIRMGLSPNMIADRQDHLRNAPVWKTYPAMEKIAPFPWEAIDLKDHVGRALADAFIQLSMLGRETFGSSQTLKNRENIKHVAQYLHRLPSQDDASPLRSWAVIRIKASPGILTSPLSKFGDCVVFVATEFWNKDDKPLNETEHSAIRLTEHNRWRGVYRELYLHVDDQKLTRIPSVT